jgi:hypothetical protein
VLVLVIVLIATNLITLAVLLRVYLRGTEHPSPDPLVAAAIEALRPPPSASGTRRIITVEILNPIELAASRGRLGGIVGTLAPGIVRRVVYEQAVRDMRRQLVQERVVADVRLHVVQPPAGGRQQPSSAAGTTTSPGAPDSARWSSAPTAGPNGAE